MPIQTLSDLNAAFDAGAWHLQRFQKNAGTAHALQWADPTFASGQPAYDAHVGTPMVFTPCVAQKNDAIYFPGIQPGQHRHLTSATFWSNQGTYNGAGSIVIFDLLGYYPLIDGDSTDLQEADNTLTLPRYTDGEGVGLVIVGVLTLPLSWRHAWSGRRGLLAAGAAAAVAVALSMWAVRGIPIVPTSVEDFRGRDAQIIQAWYDTALATPLASSVEQARAMYETALPRTLEPARRPTFGDGPGQYMIREVGGELEFSWVNWFGQQMIDPARAPMAGRDRQP